MHIFASQLQKQTQSQQRLTSMRFLIFESVALLIRAAFPSLLSPHPGTQERGDAFREDLLTHRKEMKKSTPHARDNPLRGI